MEKILTIVVPTYNAQAYLRDNLEAFCIEEILPDIEVLVVNDGSTDNSADIAEEYVKRYPNSFRLINKKNGGHGSGINCGILNATGRYFKVVDADDWVDQNAFVRLVQTLRIRDSDVVYSGFYWVFDQGQPEKEQFKKKLEIEQPFEGVNYEDEYRFDSVANGLYMKMHNMTIKTELLRENGIAIDENCFYVDTEYITYPIPYVQTISFVDEVVYMYRIGRQGQSVAIEKMQRNEENYDKVISSLLKFYSMLGGQIACTPVKKNYIADIIARVVAGKIKIMLSFPPSEEKKKQIQMFDENLKTCYPEVYGRNRNRAVKALRKTRYLMYYPASMLVRKKYK